MFGDFLREHVVHLALYGVAILAFGAIERLRPVERQSPRAFLFNFALFTTIYIALSGYYFGMAILHRHIEHFRFLHLGLPDFLGRDFSAAELAMRFVLFLLAADLIKYWMHRAMHAAPLLWRFHRAHHSDRHFNSSTNLREQWAGAIYGDVVFALIAAPLFGALTTPIPLTAAYVAYGFFAHSNLRLPLGRVTPMLVGPHYHRIHHSRLPEHANVNFASFFPLFDILFGTYYGPSRDEFPPTGLADEQHDDLWRMQLLPFQPAPPPVRIPAVAPAVPAE